ncbi:hypothetical protein CLV62_101441 [Dysgonomonas alginatilytica]|uniref:Uncharacterized protein n=1 Tax=Dysgonomonas alginatilytica TaxID=1605892 RepID=A0A2V3PVL6_9BACT|nr:hypothetical protein [Dysgonomonas alginatilytica]PXV69172.1 hypothetical protein CLV62_101441 [Dysgonomonas alginatilytica]
MKIKLIIIFLLCSLLSFAQNVGINMKNPQAVFHVDPLGDSDNTSIPSRYVDDVIINNQGRIGIGTSLPTSKIDIIGKLQFLDGNQARGKVLFSDATGLASWKVSQFNRQSVWVLSNAAGGMSFSLTTPVQIKGTGSMIEANIVGIVNVSNTNGNFVYVPAGKYITILEGQLLSRKGVLGVQEAVNTYGRIGLRSWEQLSTAADIYTLFTNKAAGSTFIYESSVGQNLYLTYAIRNYHPFIGIYQDGPHNNATFLFTLTFIKL